MPDVKKLADISMKIISYAGMAKSDYILALNAVKKGEFDDFEENIKYGDENYKIAHNFHGDILKKETETLEPQVSLLLMHAEDQLLNAETIRFLVMELVDLYRKKENETDGTI